MFRSKQMTYTAIYAAGLSKEALDQCNVGQISATIKEDASRTQRQTA
jgi:hypothetical protein